MMEILFIPDVLATHRSGRGLMIQVHFRTSRCIGSSPVLQVSEARAAVTCSLPASPPVSVTCMSYSTAPEAKDKYLSFFGFKPYPGHNLQREEQILFSISSLIKNVPELIFTTIHGPVNHPAPQGTVLAPWEHEEICTKCRNQP